MFFRSYRKRLSKMKKIFQNEYRLIKIFCADSSLLTITRHIPFVQKIKIHTIEDIMRIYEWESLNLFRHYQDWQMILQIWLSVRSKPGIHGHTVRRMVLESRETDDQDLVHGSVTKGEDAKICQSYVQLRNLIQEWTLAIVSSNRSRKTRIITTSKIIIFNLIENIDLFLKQRLKNISKITDLNMLDKDSLKNLSHGSKIKGSADTSKISRHHKIL